MSICRGTYFGPRAAHTIYSTIIYSRRAPATTGRPKRHLRSAPQRCRHVHNLLASNAQTNRRGLPPSSRLSSHPALSFPTRVPKDANHSKGKSRKKVATEPRHLAAVGRGGSSGIVVHLVHEVMRHTPPTQGNELNNIGIPSTGSWTR